MSWYNSMYYLEHYAYRKVWNINVDKKKENTGFGKVKYKKVY